MHGTYCSQIGHSGANLGLFCSEFRSDNGTYYSQIGHSGTNLGLFVPNSSLLMEHFVLKLVT